MKYQLIVKNASLEKIASRLLFSNIKHLIEEVSFFTQDDGKVSIEFNIEFTENSNEKIIFEQFLKESSSIERWRRLG